MINILHFILLASPTIVEAYLDLKNYKKGKPDKKKGRDMVFRIIGMLVASVIVSLTGGESWWQSALLSGGLFVMFFDVIMAVAMKKKFWYLGTTSRIDRALGSLPWIYVMLIRGFIFVCTATIYYDLDKVLYGRW